MYIANCKCCIFDVVSQIILTFSSSYIQEINLRSSVRGVRAMTGEADQIIIHL